MGNYKDKEWLEERYKTLSAKEIAEECGVGYVIIYRYLNRFSIDKKRDKNKKILNKDTLIELYINKELSLKEISELYGVSKGTIDNYLKKYNIPLRKIKTILEKDVFTKETLEKLYNIDCLSKEEIAKKYSISKSTVGFCLKSYGIKKVYKNKNKYFEDPVWLKNAYENMLIKDIVKITGYSTSTINHFLKLFNICENKFDPKRYTKKDWLENNYKNSSIEEIAKSCGVKEIIIKKYMKKNNIPFDGEIIKIKPTKEILEIMYNVQKLSSCKIAKITGYSETTIKKELKKYNIQIRDKTNKVITYDLLKEMYVDKNMSGVEISKKLGISIFVVYDRIKKFNISIFDRTFKDILTKDILYKMYIEDKMSSNEIGSFFNCDGATISKYLEKHAIEKRTSSEACSLAFQNIENKIKSSAGHQGISIDEWSGFSTSIDSRIRKSKEYIAFRNTVFVRDDYTCLCCGERGANINAHHLYNFSSNKDLRFDVTNGITMCKVCHDEFHKLFGYKNNNPQQIEEYIKKYFNCSNIKVA